MRQPLLLFTALILAVSACADMPMAPAPLAEAAPAVLASNSTPASNAATVVKVPWFLSYVSSCTGTVYEGDLVAHFVDRFWERSESSYSTEHLFIGGFMKNMATGQTVRLNEIAKFEQVVIGFDGIARYHYRFRFIPIGADGKAMETLSFSIVIRWEPFTIEDTIRGKCF